MAIVATYDPSTNVGKVRLYILDKDMSAPQFIDEEINAFITEAGSSQLRAAAGLALLSWAAALAREDESVKVGSWSGDRRDVASKLRDLAQEYFAMDNYAPGVQAPSFGFVNVDWTGAVQTEREAVED